MKNSFCLIIVKIAISISLLSSLSCSKPSTPSVTKAATMFKFSADGYDYQWNGVPGDGATCILCGSDIKKDNGYFILRSSDPKFWASGISLKIQATNLSVTTYTLTTINTTTPSNAYHHISIERHIQTYPPAPVFLNADATEPGDYATITITNIHDGIYADGVFNARMTISPYGPAAAKLDISGGEFRNLKIVQ